MFESQRIQCADQNMGLGDHDIVHSLALSPLYDLRILWLFLDEKYNCLFTIYKHVIILLGMQINATTLEYNVAECC